MTEIFDAEEMGITGLEPVKKSMLAHAKRIENHEGLMQAVYTASHKMYRPGIDEKTLGRADYWVILSNPGLPEELVLANTLAEPGQRVMNALEQDARQ